MATPSIEEVLVSFEDGKRVFVGNRIPLDKAQNVRVSCKMPKNTRLVFLADNTLLRGAREGFAISEDRLYWKNNMFSKSGVVALSQLVGSEFIDEQSEVVVRSLDGSHDEFSISAALLDSGTIKEVLESVKSVAIDEVTPISWTVAK